MQLGDITTTSRKLFGVTADFTCLILLVLSFNTGCNTENEFLKIAESTPGLKVLKKQQGVLKIICTSEEGLRIAGNHVTSINRPVYLSIDQCAVSSEHLLPLSSLGFLRVLFVRCDFTEDALECLADNDSLDYLSFLECSLTDKHLASLKNAIKLKRLSIVDCPQFHGTTFLDWEINNLMTDLSLTRSGVVDRAVPGIMTAFPNLRKCSLKDTQVSVDGYMQLASLAELRPSFPEHLAEDMETEADLLEEYNRRYRINHPDRDPPYSLSFFGRPKTAISP